MGWKSRIQANVVNEAKRILRGLACSAAIVLALATVSAKATEYEMIRLLPPDPNANFSKAYCINDDGEILGSYGQVKDNPQRGDPNPILWTKRFMYKDGDYRELNIPVNCLSKINNWGDILAGNKVYKLNDSEDVGFTGIDLNNKGEVLEEEFLYREGEIIDVNVSIGYYFKTRSINDKSQVVGYLIQDHHYGFLWEDGVTTRIDGLWKAYDINNNGTIVGQYEYHPPQLYPGLWKEGVAIQLPGGPGSAIAINDLEQVVGNRSSTGRPFIYENGETTYLDILIPEDSGWTRLYMASDINIKGQIIGQGSFEDNIYEFGFLANPIQKPKTLSADLNDDGIVNGLDLAKLGDQWLEKEDWYEE